MQYFGSFDFVHVDVLGSFFIVGFAILHQIKPVYFILDDWWSIIVVDAAVS